MPTKRKRQPGPEVEGLRAELDAPLGDDARQLLERASLRAGRQLFTIPQARAALAEIGFLAKVRNAGLMERGQVLAELLLQLRSEEAMLESGKLTLTLTDQRLAGADFWVHVAVNSGSMRLELRVIKPPKARKARPARASAVPSAGCPHVR